MDKCWDRSALCAFKAFEYRSLTSPSAIRKRAELWVHMNNTVLVVCLHNVKAHIILTMVRNFFISTYPIISTIIEITIVDKVMEV